MLVLSSVIETPTSGTTQIVLDFVPTDPSIPGVEIFGEHEALIDLSDGGGEEISDLSIPEDMVLLLGDHRGNSVDGRFFGLVPSSKIYARAIAVYWRSGEGLVWRRL